MVFASATKNANAMKATRAATVRRLSVLKIAPGMVFVSSPDNVTVSLDGSAWTVVPLCARKLPIAVVAVNALPLMSVRANLVGADLNATSSGARMAATRTESVLVPSAVSVSQAGPETLVRSQIAVLSINARPTVSVFSQIIAHVMLAGADPSVRYLFAIVLSPVLAMVTVSTRKFASAMMALQAQNANSVSSRRTPWPSTAPSILSTTYGLCSIRKKLSLLKPGSTYLQLDLG